MSARQANTKTASETVFETRDFYLASFLRCTGYDLIDLRAGRAAQGFRLP